MGSVYLDAKGRLATKYMAKNRFFPWISYKLEGLCLWAAYLDANAEGEGEGGDNGYSKTGYFLA